MTIDEEIRPRVRVGAIIVGDEGILLVKHRRSDREYWLLPGGGLQYGESIATAVAREIWEETRLQAEIGDLAMIAETIAPDLSRHVVHLIFRATVTGGTVQEGEDPRVVEAAYHPLEAVEHLELHPPMGRELSNFLAGDALFPKYVGLLWRD